MSASPITVARRHPPLVALGAGLLGAALCVVGALLDPRRAAAAWLVAWAAAVSTALGALALLMIGRLTNARWLVVPRRLFEAAPAALPALALLGVPILVAVPVLYPWAWAPARLAPAVAEVVAKKAAWLDVPVFVARAIAYLLVWVALGELWRRASRRQDDPYGTVSGAVAERAGRRLTRLAAAGLPVLALTLTFAAFDWLMSLDPAWYSTIFGALWWAGGTVGALALAAALAGRTAAGSTAAQLEAAHRHAIGKLLLTFVTLWAYFGFSQLLIIWIARVPVETAWYAIRLRGSWGVVSAVLLGAGFVLPFVLLLPRATKRSRVALAALGWWLLALHWLETYWLAMPAVTPRGVRPHWLDAAAVLAVGGLATAFAAWRTGDDAAVPRGDPDYAASAAYDVA